MPRYIDPTPKYTDSSDEPLPNGLLYFYESGTNTQKTTYADVNQTIANPHPLVLNGDGSVPNCFYSGAAKVVLADSDDVQIWERDPVVGAESSSFGSSWDSISVYGLNEVVTFNDVLYVSIIQNNQNNNPSSVPSAWTQFDLLRRWNVNETYNSGDPVTASDFTVYISTGNGNIGNNPVGDGGVNWVASGTGSGGLFSFIDWNSSVSYGEGKANIVTGSDDNYYISIEGTGNLNKDPISEPSYWSRYNLVGDYNLNQTYNIGDIVSYNSALYTSLTASNTGNQPDLSSSDWELISGVNDNFLINGGFDFWQRGTSGTTAGVGFYLADRWQQSSGTGATWSVDRESFPVGQTDVEGSPVYFYTYDLSVAPADSTSVTTLIEDAETLSGETATLSFWVKGSLTSTVSINIVQQLQSGNVITPADSFSITGTWTKYEFQLAIPSISGATKGTSSALGIRFITDSPATGAFSLSSVKLEQGSVATPFVRAGNTLAGELAMCQRYYEQGRFGFNCSGNGTTEYIGLQFASTKRAVPTGTAAVFNDPDGTGVSVSGFSSSRIDSYPRIILSAVVAANSRLDIEWTADSEL